MLQTIKGRTCKYITGDDDESDDDDNDDVVGPVDIIRTFERAELTKDIRDNISRCFSSMMAAHALMHQAFTEASKLIPVLPKRGMALLLEAMATGSIVVQNTKAFNILQEAKAHRQIRDEIKAQENKTCAIDLRIEKQRNHMLPNWKHPIFYQERGSKVGKVAAAVAVYIRYVLGEGHKEVPLMTVGEMFAIGQRTARKVVTEKLYDTEG